MTENKVKFITACIIQSLSYLRKEKIINRDVKMQNIIMDKQGYFNLIDFSFAIKYSEKNKSQTFFKISSLESSPETNQFSLYDYNSDYYRIGVIIYYLIFKKYVNNVKKEKKIKTIQINPNTVKNFSSSCIDFLNKLIIHDYKKRIGFKSINELKEHKWFKGFNWKQLENKTMKSPFKFISNKNRKCKKDYKKSNDTKKINYNNIFLSKYDYFNRDIVNKILQSRNSTIKKSNEKKK